MKSDQKIIDEGKERFARVEAWEADTRTNFVFDMKFANGDSSNLYQWPLDVSHDRASSNRPCLTINKTMQHCLQIINDQRQNQSQIEVRPVGNGASFKSAQVFEGIVRHIEYNSNAQAAYTNASHSQIIAGIGYWRVTTDYAHDDSFDQEIYIRRIADPLSVYLDPDMTEADGSDARWAFIFKDMPRDEFEALYPGEDDVASSAPLGGGGGGDDPWDTEDHVRVVEYFRRGSKTDTLHELDNGDTVRESDVKQANLLDQLKLNSVRTREIEMPTIDWYLIAGSKIIEKKEWPGKYIPIVRVPGIETVIDGRLDRRGHCRALIDPQRIYNYWSSSAVEFVALQSKTPYVTSVEAINGFEQNWANANVDNKAYLPYNGLTEAGVEIPKPERAPPPVMSQAYLAGIQMAKDELMMVSGQYEANMGMKSNEVSGTAVDARQRQGENATYHFIDRFSQAIRFTGRILIDLIPKIYDTERVVMILAENGEQSLVQINPNSPDGHQQMQTPDTPEFDPRAITSIFNPKVGQYTVESDIGPAFATRRQETFHAISELVKADTQMFPIVGDILMRAADFPMADELAERLHRMVPKQALGVGPPPEIAQLQQQLAEQHTVMAKLSQQLAMAKQQIGNADAKNEIEVYRSETDRMKALGGIDPNAFRVVIRQLISEALGTPINPIIAAHATENAAMAQPPPAPTATPQG